MVQYSTVQYSVLQYIAVQYSAVHYSTLQHSTVQCITVRYSTVQCSTVHVIQCSAVQYSAWNNNSELVSRSKSKIGMACHALHSSKSRTSLKTSLQMHKTSSQVQLTRQDFSTDSTRQVQNSAIILEMCQRQDQNESQLAWRDLICTVQSQGQVCRNDRILEKG